MKIHQSSRRDPSNRATFNDRTGQWFATIAALAMVGLFQNATPATAGNLHTWVSNTKGDTLDGCGTYIDGPCSDLQIAINQTDPGGEVQCVDLMPYLRTTVAITKSITLTCNDVIHSNAGASLIGAFTISIGPSDTVVFRRLNLNGARYAYQGLAIQFNGSGTLILDNVTATNWVDGGVFFYPNGPAQLKVLNSHFANIGNFSTNAGAGIRIVPQGTGSARVQLDHVSVDGSVFGIAADGNSSTGGVNITVSNSELNGNKNDGLIAVTSAGHAPIGMFVTNVRTTNNGYGIRSIGPNVTVRVKDTAIVGNGTGLSASGGGALLSMGQNAVQANGTKGAFSGTIALE